MRTVWIRGQGGVLVRADAIITLTTAHDTLNAECAGGRTVRLADSECPGALQLALLDEIRRAGADDRHAVVIMPPAERDLPTWRRECADTLLELLAANDGELCGGDPFLQDARLPGRAPTRVRGCMKHGISVYGWQQDRDGGFSARHPELVTSKGTLQLRPDDAAGIGDEEFLDLVRAALAP